MLHTAVVALAVAEAINPASAAALWSRRRTRRGFAADWMCIGDGLEVFPQHDVLAAQYHRHLLPWCSGASLIAAASATPAAPSIIQRSLAAIRRIACLISASLTSTLRSIGCWHSGKVTACSTPPAVPSDGFLALPPEDMARFQRAVQAGGVFRPAGDKLRVRRQCRRTVPIPAI